MSTATEMSPESSIASARGTERRRSEPVSKTALWIGIQIGVFVLAGGAWWLLSIVLPSSTMPTPFDTLARLGDLLTTSDFWEAVGVTVWTFILALLASIAVGVPLGLTIGARDFATQSTRLLFDFLRNIPPIAILPLLLLLIGPEMAMVFFLAVAGAVWPILIQSISAARQGEPLLREVSKIFRFPRGWYVRHIFIPGAMPFVMTGIRLGATISLLLTVAGQLLGNAPGIGFEIADAQAFYDNTRVYSYVLVSAILGIVVNSVFWAVQRKVLRWHPSFRGQVHA